MSHEELLRRLNETEKELETANNIIIELESKIAEMVSLQALSGTEKVMLDIIEREVLRINMEQALAQKMTKEDLRAFDVLVKDFVAIRGKIIPEKPKEKESEDDNIENLISLVQGNG